MKKVLVTGFGPFLNHTSNPSQLIAEALHGTRIAGAKVTALTLPVVFGEDTRLVLPAIRELKPALVLEFGLRGQGPEIDVEMFAINHRSEPGDETLVSIVPGSPDAYFATIDTRRVAQAISSRAGIIARRHGYAGSYLCNHVFYQTLHFAASLPDPPRVGFVHIPFAREFIDDCLTKARNAQPIARLIDAAKIAVDTAIR